MRNSVDLAYKLLGKDSVTKGLKIDKHDVFYIDSVDGTKNELVNFFRVNSQSSHYYYDVSIIVNKNQVSSYYCECEQFRNYHTCKHVAACLIYNSDIILGDVIDKSDISNNILELFNRDSFFGIREKVGIDIELVKKSDDRIRKYISNDNEFAGEIRSVEQLTLILENLEKYTLKWTSQSLMQKIFTYFRIKINADEESKFNWYFGIFGFIFIVGLRCFLFARKMSRDQANSLSLEKSTIVICIYPLSLTSKCFAINSPSFQSITAKIKSV